MEDFRLLLFAIAGIVFSSFSLQADDMVADEIQQSRDNLQQIALAFHNYHDAHGKLPGFASLDPTGKPLLSWRVHLLPFLGADAKALQEVVRLDEPWDSEHNKKLLRVIPSVYSTPLAAPLERGYTCYLVPRSDLALFPDHAVGLKFGDIYQGLPNIVLVVEGDRGAAVPWTKPSDLPFRSDAPLTMLGQLRQKGFLLGWASGQVSFIPNSIGTTHPDRTEFLRGMFEMVGGRGIPYYLGLE